MSIGGGCKKRRHGDSTKKHFFCPRLVGTFSKNVTLLLDRLGFKDYSELRIFIDRAKGSVRCGLLSNGNLRRPIPFALYRGEEKYEPFASILETQRISVF